MSDPTDRRWSDADRELVRPYIAGGRWCTNTPCADCDERADELLDALTAAGWRPTVPTAEEIAVAAEAAGHAVESLIAARVRAAVAEEIAQAIEDAPPSHCGCGCACAEIARARAEMDRRA